MIVRELLARVGFEVDKGSVDKASTAIQGMQARLSLLAGAEILRGIAHLTAHFSHFGEQLKSNALAAGVNTDQLQEMSYAATQNALTHEELTGALSKLTRNMYEARTGNKTAAEAFAKLGISPGQIGSFGNASEAMQVMSDRIKAIRDPVERQAVMMELLGRGSANMAQFMSIGSKEMKALGGRAHELGLVLKDADSSALQEFGDTLATLVLQIKVMSATIGAAFAPSLKFVVERITAFIAANKEILAISFNKWVYSITYAMGYAYGVLEDLGGAVMRFVDRHPVLVKNVGLAAAALLGMSAGMTVVGFILSTLFSPIKTIISLLSGVGGVAVTLFPLLRDGAGMAVKGIALLGGGIARMAAAITGLVASTLPALGAAIQAVGAAIAATPIGWLVAGFAALVLVIHDVWTLLSGGKFEDTWIGKAYEGVKKLYDAMRKMLGLGSDATVTTTEVVRQSVIDAEGTPSLLRADAGTGLAANADAMMQRLQAIPQQFPQATLAPGAFPPLAAVEGGGASTYNVDAPITVNVPAGTDPQAVARAAQDGVREHLARVMRETGRGVAAAVRY